MWINRKRHTSGLLGVLRWQGQWSLAVISGRYFVPYEIISIQCLRKLSEFLCSFPTWSYGSLIILVSQGLENKLSPGNTEGCLNSDYLLPPTHPTLTHSRLWVNEGFEHIIYYWVSIRGWRRPRGKKIFAFGSWATTWWCNVSFFVALEGLCFHFLIWVSNVTCKHIYFYLLFHIAGSYSNKCHSGWIKEVLPWQIFWNWFVIKLLIVTLCYLSQMWQLMQPSQQYGGKNITKKLFHTVWNFTAITPSCSAVKFVKWFEQIFLDLNSFKDCV